MYPKTIDEFTEKLNKLDNDVYVIEEEVKVNNGIYQGELKHDNINNISVRVYTGSKLTGNKMENFILSTPSTTPWKTEIKIFAKVDKCYITYETFGDTVEADDINKVQESIINTQIEIDNYKKENNKNVSSKAEIDYVDLQLNNRYLKNQVFTKKEVIQKIQNVIGVAPEALDTLQEIARALNNDADFASTITKQLSNKIDKVVGKQLSTEDFSSVEKSKLAGIQNNANNYVHPSTHPVTMITGLSSVAINGEYNSLKNKPTVFPPSKHNHDENYIKKGVVTWNDLRGV